MTSLDTELSHLAHQVSSAAAALIRERRRGDVAVAATKTSGTDVVTEVDRASEALIKGMLRDARPGDAFVGEETGSDAGDGTTAAEVRWIVDPVDGTVNLLYGQPMYAVSVAAELNGEVVAGVVVNVPQNITYSAVRGRGATRDGVTLTVRPEVPVSQRLVLTGFSYDGDLRAFQGAAIGRLLPHVRDIRRLGSAALDLCLVAEGAADGYVEEGVHVWDYAAGALIAREAGARVELTRTAHGREMIWCAPADGFDAFATAVADSGLGVAPTA